MRGRWKPEEDIQPNRRGRETTWEEKESGARELSRSQCVEPHPSRPLPSRISLFFRPFPPRPVSAASLSVPPFNVVRSAYLFFIIGIKHRLLFYNNRRCCGRTALVAPFAMPEEQLSNYCKEQSGETRDGERENERKERGIAINCQCLVTLTSRALEHALWVLSLKSRVPVHGTILVINRKANYFYRNRSNGKNRSKREQCFETKIGRANRRKEYFVKGNRDDSWHQSPNLRY